MGGSVTPDAYDPSICYANTGVVGMVPLQKVVQDEYSFTIGARGETNGWNYDLSTTYGQRGQWQHLNGDLDIAGFDQDFAQATCDLA